MKNSRVRYIKIPELMLILSQMLNKNIYFTDLYYDGETIYFTPSKIPSKNEIEGDDIISKIDFNEED